MRLALLLAVAIVVLGLAGRAFFCASMLMTNNEFGKGAEIMPGLNASVEDRYRNIKSMLGDEASTAATGDQQLTPQEEYARNQKVVEPAEVRTNPFLAP